MSDKLVINNIGLLLSGKMEEPILDGDCVIAIDGKIAEIGYQKDMDCEGATTTVDAHGVALAPGLIDPIDHRGERRGLSAAGGARHQDEPLGQVAEIGTDIQREPKLLEAADLVGNHTKHATHGAALKEDVCTETPESGDTEGEVQLVFLLKLRDLLCIKHAVDQAFGLVRVQRIGRCVLQLAV